MYVGETQMGNEGQGFRIQAVEMNYFRGACGLNMIDGDSNENVYGKLDLLILKE